MTVVGMIGFGFVFLHLPVNLLVYPKNRAYSLA
jgi:hypothetical protein